MEGYASLFGEIDQARDMVMRGAFADTLAARGVRRIPMLFQHDPAEPVGVWLELREDHRGLYARGRLIPEVARARELLSLLRAGAIDGLSIGFRTVKGNIDPRTRIRRLVRGRPVGNFHRHVPAARGSARARGEAGDLPAELSPARTRAERAWGKLAGAADVPAPASLASPDSAPRTRAPLRECRRSDGSLMSGRLRGWRARDERCCPTIPSCCARSPYARSRASCCA